MSGLRNYGMPLLRYRTGDLGVLGDRACPCGRGLPILERIEGRSIDVLSTTAGTPVYGSFVNAIVRPHTCIIQYQICQRSLDQIVIRVVLERETELTSTQRDEVTTGIRQRLGDGVAVVWEVVDSLANESSGKFRYIRSELPSGASERAT